MPRHEVPAVPGVLTAADIELTADFIADCQEPSGALPWFPGGRTDPWDHVESAMALSATGRFTAAEAAYEWSRRTQREDGSWPLEMVESAVTDPAADTNFCAYLAVGVRHHHLVSGDADFALRMWPTVRRAIDFVLELQNPGGDIHWARGRDGTPAGESLLSGCSSIHHSLRCAVELAEIVDEPQPEWEVALATLRHAITAHREAFAPRERYSMDWYYPVLGGALTGTAATERLRASWDEFVVPGLGIRCVNDHPWVTGAETCELVLALHARGEHANARDLFTAIQHLRDTDGSYWTGLVYSDGKRWPEERTTWTSAAVVLAADALSSSTPGSRIFVADERLSGAAETRDTCDCQLSLSG